MLLRVLISANADARHFFLPCLQVLYLDSDNVALLDPTDLFDFAGCVVCARASRIAG